MSKVLKGVRKHAPPFNLLVPWIYIRDECPETCTSASTS